MTAPTLAIDGGDRVGRLYRQPGQDLPDRVQFDETGRPSLRRRDAERAVIDGTLVPSITNVLGVRNMPHLQGWYAKKAAEEAVQVARNHPGLLAEKPAKAVEYIKGAADRDRDQAAVNGDAVHKACEDLARGLPCPPLSPEQVPYVDSWKAWLDRWQPEFIALEATVYGRTPSGLPYAGTGDLLFKVQDVVVVGDYKTTRTGLHALDLACQLSAIVHADDMVIDPERDETAVPMLPAQAAVGIHLSPEGYQVKPVLDLPGAWRQFCALREAWDAHVLEATLRGGARVLGQSLSGPEALVPMVGTSRSDRLSA